MLNMRGSQLSRRVAKPGIDHPPPKAGDLSGRLRLRVDLSAVVLQPCPFVPHSFLIEISHLRQIGSAPEVTTPKNRRNPRKFQTAVWDLVGRTETPIG